NNWARSFNINLMGRFLFVLVTATAQVQGGRPLTRQRWLACMAGTPAPPLPGPAAAAVGPAPAVLITALTLSAEALPAFARQLRVQGTIFPPAAAISPTAFDASLNQYHAFPLIPAPPAGQWVFDFFNIPTGIDLSLFFIGQSGTHTFGQAL